MIYKNSTLNNNWTFLSDIKQKSRLPNALLFHGNDGIGKESTAIEFAAYVNCQQESVESACGKCSSCSKIKSNNCEYIDYIFPLPKGKIKTKKDSMSKSFTEKTLIEYNYELKEKLINPFHSISISGANTILINSIREIKKKLYRSTDSGIQKIVIIFEAEKLCHPNQEAANSLLKILEEPPSNSTFILVTSKSSLLLDTIKSRCIEVFFQKPSISQFDMHNNLNPSSINLYKLLDGNIKNLKKLTDSHINQIEDFIKNYHIAIRNKDIDLKLISYMSKLFKTENFLFQCFVQGMKHYYKDILSLNIDNEKYELTFKFLNSYKIDPNKKTFDCIDIIEQFEKDILIKLNLDLSLFNLFHNLKASS